VRYPTTAAALLATAVLAGCSSPPPPDAAAPVTVTVPAPSPADGPSDEHAGLGTPQPAPTWDAAAEQDARLLALDAMRAYAQPDRDPQTWYEVLAGHLTATGQAEQYGTDPTTITARTVRDATVTSPSAYLATAQVDTDGGTYAVLMVREDGASPWRVERITPPAR